MVLIVERLGHPIDHNTQDVFFGNLGIRKVLELDYRMIAGTDLVRLPVDRDLNQVRLIVFVGARIKDWALIKQNFGGQFDLFIARSLVVTEEHKVWT